MAEIPGTSGVGVSRSGASAQGHGATGWREDLRDTMETSDALFSQYEQTDDIDFLNEAIALAERSLTAITTLHPSRAVLSAKLCKMFGSKFEHTQDVVDLDMAWAWGMEEMDTAPGNTITSATACGSVLAMRRRVESTHSRSRLPGMVLFRRYKRLGNVSDLNEAIIEMERAMEACHPGDAGRVDMLGSWSVMLRARFERLGDINDLEVAADMCEEVLRRTVSGDPSYVNALGNLGAILLRRFQRIGDLEDLEKAIKHSEEAVAVTSQDHPDRAGRYNNLGAMFSMMFKRIGDLHDLQKAIRYGEEAVTVTPQDHPDRAGRYNNLGAMFYIMFKRIGDLHDLQKAIRYGEEAVNVTPQDHPDRAGRYHNLGLMFSTRFKRIGDLDDLQKSINHGEEVLATTPRDHPDRARRYHSLGNMLSTRFRRIGDIGDLQKAIKLSEEALAATPQDHPDRADRYHNLGFMFSTRFKRIGDLDDLQKAINHGEEALATTPRDHPDRARRYHNLGNMLSTRFGRIGDIDDLQKAIKLSEEALAVTPQNHPDRADRYSNLGVMFSTRFERIGDLDDLQKAINHGGKALATTPRDHPDRARRYHNLGNMLSTRFGRIGDIDDLQKAIKLNEEALAATPQDHPHRAGVYLNLGMSLKSRYMLANSVEDFNKCLGLYHQAWHCRTSPPRYRIRAARSAAHLLYSGGRFHESSSILEDAIHLMPSVNLQLLKRDDQQHILSELSGLASIAASMALQAGREAYHSLKLLELGRGIIMGFTINSRSEVSDFKADHELKFDQFHRLRVEIDSSMDETIGETGETQDQRRNRAISRRWEAVNKMEKVLTRIRNLPGYSGFLLPPSREALMDMAANGPIIIFNSTFVRSDAIIVTTSAITSLELPRLNQKETDHWMTKLASFGGGGGFKRVQDNKQMKDLLVWLWDAAVGPVFDHLERTGTIISNGVDNSTLKRIWWIGVGQLSMAPFHAAGDHSRGSTRNCSSRAISTYIPTIKALSYARQKKLQLFTRYATSLSTECVRKSKNKKARLLLVPMPKTPDATSLPGVDEEVQYIRDSATKSAIEITVLSNPTPAEVLKQVQHHDIAHFACHGMSDINPSDSHLVLLTPDGNNADKLLARDISSLNTPGAQLAYLSSSFSAKNASTDLADEVIHLASAFQLAGFSHTLANLWEIEDRASSEVARDFYNLLFQDRENVNDHYQVAAAFHEAVKRVRDKRPANYLGWAPFVHTGA